MYNILYSYQMTAKLILISVFLLFANCINNVEDQVPDIPDGPVSYATQIQPIFNNSCGGSACHTNGGSRSNVDLSTYQDAINSIGALYQTEVIKPGNADNSPLVDKLDSNPEFGSQMPLGRRISSQDIGLIIAWINQGAENN